MQSFKNQRTLSLHKALSETAQREVTEATNAIDVLTTAVHSGMNYVIELGDYSEQAQRIYAKSSSHRPINKLKRCNSEIYIDSDGNKLTSLHFRVSSR